MKIYYDGIIYRHYNCRPGGISNFFDHLISNISQHHDCLLTSSRPRHLPHPSGPKLKIYHNSLKLKPARLNNKIESLKFAVKASLFRPQLIHATYYCNPSIIIASTPIIYTVYDMILEKWSSDMDPSGRLIKEKRRSLERAFALPCISNTTRNDLLNLYPHLEPKTSVIYLAGEPNYEALKSQTDTSRLSANPYLLYVGARSSYKNFQRFILAFAQASERILQLRLKVVGAPWTTDEEDYLKHLGIINKVESFPDLNDLGLYELYKKAIAFVYPSLYEGFGLPLLEAMSLGTPVLASNTSSIPEVTGDAALLFNPWSVDSIYDAIIEISINKQLREKLRQKGNRRCLDFSWEKTSAEYLELYKSILRKSARK